ncbi:hypothetical protein CI15_13675 [Paraburkholderia monticola]|uniref:Transposase IS66 central domain-containing protein n=1 Tax=Paraburkholderia monticola TaxID=1399968 RepID=A0A149PSA2_9BURK|nr:hypothetical protein CI15_13675 [Paraburkholderia monticola]
MSQRKLVPEGSAIANALDYSPKRWEALTRYPDDRHVPIDNNWVENQIRPWAIGRANWLVAGSLASGLTRHSHHVPAVLSTTQCT